MTSKASRSLKVLRRPLRRHLKAKMTITKMKIRKRIALVVR